MKVIITGATGMVGEGVMHTCLNHSEIDEVLVLVRKSTEVQHPKLKEIIHSDFFDWSAVEDKLTGYDACLFCLGVSSVGMDKDEYFRLTHTLTLALATVLAKQNPTMAFSYISGTGTDSTEKGKINWARVKGKTENDLRQLPFKNVFAFRPGFIKPMKGMKHTHSYYTYVSWMYPIGRFFYPSGFTTLEVLATAMINVSLNSYEKWILEGKDIIKIANR